MIRYVFRGWEDRMVPIGSVNAHPQNPNEGDVDAVIESILTNGCYRDVWVQESSDLIVAGHHLYYAHLALEMEMLPVTYLDVDDEAAERILLVDNELTRQGRYNEPNLLALLERQAASPLRLTGTGFAMRDVQRLRHILDRPMGLLDISVTPIPPDELRLVRQTRCPECDHVFVPKPLLSGGSDD